MLYFVDIFLGYLLMKIDLRKNFGKTYQLQITERLPAQVHSPIDLKFSYTVESYKDYYLMNLTEDATLQLTCQRCGEIYDYHYQQSHQLAICVSEEVAEFYQSKYDVVVCSDFIVDILPVLTDNMHLFLPLNHEKVDYCNQNQLKLLQNSII